MGDYNLTGLSTRSFEQLIQAIAAKVIGPNIVIFGDGPDGGREATFEGSIPYPSKEHGWSGYGVVQAKFRQRSQDTQKDGEWALQQLRDELDKFVDPKRNLGKTMRNRGHGVPHRSISCCSALERRPRRLGGCQRGGGTRCHNNSATLQQ